MNEDSSKKNPPKKSFASMGTMELSFHIGYDVRDLLLSGYSAQQIIGVAEGKYTLQELFEMKPEDKPQS